MSLLYMDSMQYFADVDTQANILRRYQGHTSASNTSFLPTDGPFGDACWNFTAQYVGPTVYGDWNKTTIYFGAWMRQQGTENGRTFMAWWEGNESTNHVLIDMGASGVGSLTIKNGGGATLGTPSGLWTQNVWNFVEFKVVIHDSAGEVTIYVNGVSAYSLTGVDTRNGGTNGWVDSIGFFGSDGGGIRWSHIAVWDNAGNAPTDFFGPYRIHYLKPTADTAQADFVPLGAGDNYVEVDEQNADDDATYNSSATSTDADEFAVENLPSTVVSVSAVQAIALARKDDAGARTIKVGVDSNGTDEVSAAQPTIPSYGYFVHLMDENPDDAAAWAPADVDAALVRYEVG